MRKAVTPLQRIIQMPADAACLANAMRFTT
jgi:hypothetical protein